MWAGWVHHSLRFGHAEVLREVGPEMPECRSKIQRCQSSEQLSEFFGRDPNDFLSRLVTMDETWRQSNNQWSDGTAAHPAPKNSECKNLLEKFSSWFFGIKKATSSLIIFQRAKLSTRSITHLCCCNWRTFWKKNAAGSSPRGSCSCKTMPRLTGHLQPRRNWPTWASRVITHPILRIWPCWTITCSMDWKSNWKVTIFLPTRRSLLPWRPGWTVNFLNFFLSDLQNLQQWAKCIELRGEYVE